MSIKNKITPGPWKVRYFDKDDLNSGFFIEASNNNMPELSYGIEILGDDYGDHNGYPANQRHADALIISKAPEMLDILERLSKCETDKIPVELRHICWDASELLNKLNEI